MPRRHPPRKIVGFVASLLFIPLALGSRSYIADYAIDLTQYIASAPIAFRGHVVSVTKTSKGFPTDAVARFQVDRLYRGSARSVLSIHFAIGLARSGDCLPFAFAPSTYWLVFAKEKSGQLEPVDSCGAVAISPVLGPNLRSADPAAQLEADLIAGLQDPSQAGRILSIQRLGGFKLASSRPALHRIIDGTKPVEAKWATYAALRTGDLSVLARVIDLLDDPANPADFAITVEFSEFKDGSALPILIEIANRSSFWLARLQAVRALGINFGSEALRCIGDHLADSDPGVRWYALLMMEKITHEPACTGHLEPRYTVEMQDRQIQSCLAWWKQQP